MKKIFIVILVLMLGCSILCGCSKLVSTEYETVRVKITDEYRRAPAGHLPPRYRITVKYEGVWYNIGGADTWEQYKGMVGETVSATLRIRTYDDGSVKRDIAALGEEDADNV